MTYHKRELVLVISLILFVLVAVWNKTNVVYRQPYYKVDDDTKHTSTSQSEMKKKMHKNTNQYEDIYQMGLPVEDRIQHLTTYMETSLSSMIRNKKVRNSKKRGHKAKTSIVDDSPNGLPVSPTNKSNMSVDIAIDSNTNKILLFSLNKSASNGDKIKLENVINREKTRYSVINEQMESLHRLKQSENNQIDIAETDELKGIDSNIEIDKTQTHDSVTHDVNKDVELVDQVKRPDKGLKQSKKKIRWFDIRHDGKGLRTKAHHVNMKKCEYNNCEILREYTIPDVNFRQYGPLGADAVVFQACHLSNFMPPIRRDEDQVFVFAERETWWYLDAYRRIMRYTSTKTRASNQGPHKTVDKLLNIYSFRDKFNWTMTYRKDSDIYLPYGEIITKRNASNKGYINDYSKIYKQKTRDVAWLVSDCNTKSKRERYVKRLREFIKIDIYGGCGNLKCPKHEDKSNGHTCLNKIEKEYKFILAFENTFHTDYVTEKLFERFNWDIVQVVYGMANYSAITPPNSVIDAASFKSPRELAIFMKSVGSDENRYIEYLKQKDRHYATGHIESQQNAYCKLCEMLNNLDRYRRQYSNIGLWWQLNHTSPIQHLYDQAVGHKGSSFGIHGPTIYGRN